MKPGIYAFKVYKPAGYPADGSTFEWSKPMTLAKCDEKPTVPKKKPSLQSKMRKKHFKTIYWKNQLKKLHLKKL